MLEKRFHASWLCQMEAYLKDIGMAGLVSTWVMTRRRPEQGGCGNALLGRMSPYVTSVSNTDLAISVYFCHCFLCK